MVETLAIVLRACSVVMFGIACLIGWHREFDHAAFVMAQAIWGLVLSGEMFDHEDKKEEPTP